VGLHPDANGEIGIGALDVSPTHRFDPCLSARPHQRRTNRGGHVEVEALEQLFGEVERPSRRVLTSVSTRLSADGSASPPKRSQNRANSGNASIR
jgi:hypothetical protein